MPLFEGLKPREVINYNGWPCRVDSAPSDGPIVVQSLSVDDLRKVDPETILGLDLDPDTLRKIAVRANMLELLDVA